MHSDKQFILNRHGQRLAVVIDEPARSRGFALVMHGLGGMKEQPHILAIAEAFLEAGNTAVRFDAANTYGESEGEYAKATITNYYEDLEDVLAWAAGRPWYREPLYLAGHSLGGISVALYAERFPQKIKGVAPISTVVSGVLSAEARGKEQLNAWQESGWDERASETLPGVIRRLPWSHMEDCLRYDLLPEAGRLTMPVLLVVGENDTSTPAAHQQRLYDALPGPKQFIIIPGAPHTFRSADDVEAVKRAVSEWLRARR